MSVQLKRKKKLWLRIFHYIMDKTHHFNFAFYFKNRKSVRLLMFDFKLKIEKQKNKQFLILFDEKYSTHTDFKHAHCLNYSSASSFQSVD